MLSENERLEKLRELAARLTRLCDEILAGLDRGTVYGARPIPGDLREKISQGGVLASGQTPEAARRDYEFRFVILLFLLFARDVFKCILALEQSGSLVPCNILARSLFEAMVSVLYIRTDPHNLAHRFLSHEFAQDYDSLVRLRREGIAVDSERAQQIEERWKSVRETHGVGKKKATPAKWWHGRKLWKLCEELRAYHPTLPKDYDYFYGLDSALSHGSAKAIGRYAERRSDARGWALCPSPPTSWRVLVLGRSVIEFVEIFEVADAVLSLNAGEGLRTLLAEIGNLMKALDAEGGG